MSRRRDAYHPYDPDRPDDGERRVPKGALANEREYEDWNPMKRTIAGLSFAVLSSLAAETWAQAAGPNLIPDPGFSSGTSGFATDSTANAVFRSTRQPIQGPASLRAYIRRSRSTVSWQGALTSPGHYQSLKVAATLRGDIVPQGSSVRLCAAARTAEAPVERCAPLALVPGRAVRGQAVLRLDPAETVSEVWLKLRHTSGARYTIDSVSARLTSAE